jgi:leucyl-tRNA synthetase
MIPAEHLPWLLPTDVDFTPTGEAPLASSKELKERVTRIFGEGWRPEYDTLDVFVDSSWYFNRYLDPKDPQKFSDMAMMKKWLPVDRYSGGAEHTTVHLLYSRFFTMALYDLALVPVEEPYKERYNRGIILGPDGAKMSKSKGNVINPDELVQKYGADAVRVYLAFMAPYGEPGSYPWQLDGVASMRRFLDRVERLVEKHKKGSEVYREALERALAKTAAKVASDGDRFKFNTSVAALMTLLNELEGAADIPKNILMQYVTLLAPFAPHIAEHLWERLGGAGSVHEQQWPAYDEALLASEHVTVVVQVAGKKRGEVTLAPDAPEAEALEAALAVPAVSAALAGATPSRTIYVPGRILNLVP